MLYETKQAGDPQEYFNPPIIALASEQSGKKELQLGEYLKLMESRRTSPNGVFGMKLHYSQMLNILKTPKPNDTALKLLKSFNKLIWIRRRNRLMQGISQAIGQQTQVWSSEDSRHADVGPIDVHPFACLNATKQIAGEDFGWERLIKAANLTVHTVWYEDLVDDYEKESRKVLQYLGLSALVDTIPEQPLKKQGGEQNLRIHEELLQYLGLAEGQQ